MEHQEYRKEYAFSMEEYNLAGIITPGIYVIGDNLAAGKYTFNAISGMGEVCIFDSYDKLLAANTSYDADENYNIKAPEASTGLTNSDVYTNSINNIRLEEGQCLYVRKGILLSYDDNYSVPNTERTAESSTTTEVVSDETSIEENNSAHDEAYAEINDEYKKKLEETTPKLINEYKKEAKANINGLDGLADINNQKVEVLAEIANEGIEKMADYMLTKGSGNYEEYSNWSGKLYDVYSDEAMKLFEVYMDSAF